MIESSKLERNTHTQGKIIKRMIIIKAKTCCNQFLGSNCARSTQSNQFPLKKVPEALLPNRRPWTTQHKKSKNPNPIKKIKFFVETNEEQVAYITPNQISTIGSSILKSTTPLVYFPKKKTESSEVRTKLRTSNHNSVLCISEIQRKRLRELTSNLHHATMMRSHRETWEEKHTHTHKKKTKFKTSDKYKTSPTNSPPEKTAFELDPMNQTSIK